MNEIIPIPAKFEAQANISKADYEALYKESITDPEGFWARMARERLTWTKEWDTVLENDFASSKVSWFRGGKLNASYNCLDRHIDTIGDKTALIWEGDSPNESRKLTYRELLHEVCRLANGLSSLGIEAGDRVALYLPMLAEGVIATHACGLLGAVQVPLFSGLAANAISARLVDGEVKAVIVADGALRRGQVHRLKETLDLALADSPSVEHVIVQARFAKISVQLDF